MPKKNPYDLELDPAHMELDPDRPFLEQFEEAALISDQALEWLKKEIYDHPDRLSLFSNIRLVKDSEY